ncbi:GNAT family N-acetyltransferase [Marinomonas pollencensis]|uniref:Acetyltransferase (GNAT) family protein n=1 Tax=Marinomonas pollencensis TaxID=491954 RepID=A0A3E0DF35_9GAMM|nr:GNAT family N-acetyltransferase [Marinomonas pollencensis]REG81316.1 acetyltransferase (GNAT) family protein [Marinomonas pollencensis]
MKESRFRWQLARYHDAGAISDLLNLAYRGEDNWTNEPQLLTGARSSQALVERNMKEAGTYFFVCRNDTALLACSRLTLAGNEAYIGSFAVLPVYQKRGMGSHLLSAIESIATKVYGVTFLSVSVLSEQKALKRFCENRGYQRNGKAEAYPAHLKIGSPKKRNTMIEFYLKRICFY